MDNSYEWTAENGHRIYVTNWKKCIKVQYEAIQRVRELHTKENWDVCPVCCTWSDEELDYLSYANPCPTIQALDGEQ